MAREAEVRRRVRYRILRDGELKVIRIDVRLDVRAKVTVDAVGVRAS
jgi:hypothetical protein